MEILREKRDTTKKKGKSGAPREGGAVREQLYEYRHMQNSLFHQHIQKNHKTSFNHYIYKSTLRKT